ncbi:MAG: ribonuclease HI, partial [Sarcina sp.]
VKGIEYALKKGAEKVVLFHDYEGIFHHATGSWGRKEASSEIYYEKMNAFFKKGIEVIFVKVDSHTGDFFNELADESCKKRLGIMSDKVVERWLSTNKLFVADETVKDKVLELIGNYSNNVIIAADEDKKLEKEIDIRNEIINRINKLSEEKCKEILSYIDKSL